MRKDLDKYIAYVDTGGTFSDAVIVKSDGTFLTGKAATSPSQLEDCFFNCLGVAGSGAGVSLAELVSSSDEIGYGTTIGTNMIVSGTPGPKLGMLTTKGFEGRTWTFRLRPAGLSKPEAMHMIASGYPHPLIARKLIKGVAGRIDAYGEVFAPLSEEDVRAAVKELLAEGVEGIAVGFLFSFLNNEHEIRARDIIKEMAPHVLVSLSSEVCPTIREYPRFMSTIIDLHIGRALRELLEKIEARLAENGYRRPLLVLQAAGGVAQSKTVKPGTTLHSGPVGGLMGVEFLKSVYGFKNAMGSDVGGTSFDVTISPERGEEFLREPVVGRYEIASPMREIITIGAGGGSIAWIDEITKTLRVGPQSAGAVPGPVCYGLGGTEPTVTDADVAMNRIDPDYFLGGTRRLDKEKAFAAIKERIADPLKMDVLAAAEGICKIADAAMQATLKTTIATKGINPAQYVLFAFGGAGPTHCAGYSAQLGFAKVIVPRQAAVFSAFGAATADVRHRYETSPFILIPDIPYNQTTLRFDTEQINSLDGIPAKGPERFNRMFQNLEEKAYADLQAEGFNRNEVEFRHEFLGRYGGQLWEIRCVSPVAQIKEAGDLRAIIKAFEDEYLRMYTREAMAPKGGIEIVSIALVASAPSAKPKLHRWDFAGADSSGAIKGEREVYFDSEWIRAKVYDMSALRTGNIIVGPTIVEARDTTLVVPTDRKVTVDEYLNLVMEYR